MLEVYSDGATPWGCLMSRSERVALLMTGKCRLVCTDPLVWLVDDRPATEWEAGLLAGTAPADVEDALGLLRTDAEMQKGLTVEALRGFVAAGKWLLESHPDWGTP